jgi:hypothetical protein
MARRSLPRKVSYFEPVAPCLARTRHRSEPRRRRVVPGLAAIRSAQGDGRCPILADALAIDEDDIRLFVMLNDGMAATADDGHQTLMPDRVAGQQGDAQRRPLPRWFADSAHRDGRRRSSR